MLGCAVVYMIVPCSIIYTRIYNVKLCNREQLLIVIVYARDTQRIQLIVVVYVRDTQRIQLIVVVYARETQRIQLIVVLYARDTERIRTRLDVHTWSYCLPETKLSKKLRNVTKCQGR